MNAKTWELAKKITKAIKKFDLNLTNSIILTEAATGNYVVTPIIAAVAGAKKIYAFTKNSNFGSVSIVEEETYSLSKTLNIKENKIFIVTSLENIDLKNVDVVTNTGFLRPITRELIDKLPPKCVIPLMYEPWEFRKGEIDLEACREKGIKVYGTNEKDKKLRTIEYIGFIVLYFLLKNKLSPFNSKILLIGCEELTIPTYKILKQNEYFVEMIVNYNTCVNVHTYDAIVILEHKRNNLIVGEKPEAFIDKHEIKKEALLIHICGNIDLKNVAFKYIPPNIRPFGYMSVTADFIDPQALVDLHTAGLKVAEGMMLANKLKLKGLDYKIFMETNYPALAFGNERYW